MTSNNETIADIVREMRGPYYKMGRSNASLDKQMMDYMSFIANRTEAAHKREVAELRECLKEAICIKCGYCRDFYRNCPTICDVNKKDCDIIAKFRRALTSNVNEEMDDMFTQVEIIK